MGGFCMIAIPFVNLIVLPGVTLYFNQDYYRELAGVEPRVGEEVMFLLMKEEQDKENLTEDSFYSIGVSGYILHRKEDVLQHADEVRLGREPVAHINHSKAVSH